MFTAANAPSRFHALRPASGREGGVHVQVLGASVALGASVQSSGEVVLTHGVPKTNRGTRRELGFAPSPQVLVSHDEAVRV